MKTVILHIGPHKTGSTSLQFALRSNRGKLEDAGVLYPVTGTGKTEARIHGHHNLAWSLRKDYRYQAQLGGWDDLRKEIDETECRYIFLSSEAFSQLNRQGVKKIRDELDGYDLRVVYIARFYPDTVRSEYSMNAVKFNVRTAAARYRARVTSSLADPARANETKRKGAAEPGISTFLHRPKLENWIDVMGKNAVRILFYDGIFRDYLGKVAAAVPLPKPLPHIELPRMNSARSLAQISIVTAMSRALDGIMDRREFNAELAPFLTHCFKDLSSSLAKPEGIPDEAIALMKPHVETDMQWLSQYAEVPQAWKILEGGPFVEPEVPSMEVGRLIAGDFISRKIKVLEEAVEKRSHGTPREITQKRKERLVEILEQLIT